MGDGEQFESDDEFRQAVRREFERKDANHLPVRVEIKGEEFEGTLEDISPKGVRLQCEEELPERGSVKIHVPYEDDGKMMHLTGVIRWSKKITEAGIELTHKTKDI